MVNFTYLSFSPMIDPLAHWVNIPHQALNQYPISRPRIIKARVRVRPTRSGFSAEIASNVSAGVREVDSQPAQNRRTVGASCPP